MTRRVASVVLGLLVTTGCAPASALPPPKPSFCPPPEAARLQQVTTTPASPYFVHHPVPEADSAGTVVFLPGGSGARRSAERAWATFLDGASALDSFRVVVPYWPDIEMVDDPHRTLEVLDELLACFGGQRTAVHLAGFSNGGHVAFDLMLEHPERFATLLGAPGEFALGTKPADLVRLRGKTVFNGIGELDDEFWHKGVRDAHEALTAAGVESAYVEFPGQAHGAGPGFPKDRLFTFWLAHSGLSGLRSRASTSAGDDRSGTATRDGSVMTGGTAQRTLGLSPDGGSVSPRGRDGHARDEWPFVRSHVR